MKKIVAALFALVLSSAMALAQGPGPGPGPGPIPNPWVISGAGIYYNGCVMVPVSVSGGCKGNGTINATTLYQNGFAVLSTDLANGKILVGNGSGVATAQTPSGDLTMTNAGVFTVSANVITNAKLAQAAAVTLKGNPTNALANVQDFTLSSLTALASPNTSLDLLLIWDHTAGTFKSVTPSALSTAVGGITALTGDVTATGPGSVAATLATAQPGAHTWAATQTFTLAPVFTDQSGSRTALGLGTAATQNTGTSGANVPLLSGANTWGATQTLPSPAFTGTVSGANTIPLGVLAQSGANTMLGNWTGSTANVAANAMPSCPDSGGNHLNYVSGTGITCGTGLGNGITSLTGDVVATGPGAAAATIQPGVVTYAKIQNVAASSLIGNPTGLSATSQAVSIGSTLAFSGTALQTGAGTGDVTWSANSFATTLATVNSNVGSFGSSTAIPVVTVNGKGLVTAVSTAAVIAPAGTLSGTTLNSTVVTSSLTTVGALGGGSATTGFTIAASNVTWTGTVPTANLPVAADTSGSPSATGGIVKCDGTTITCSSGVITAVGAVAASIDAGGATSISNGTDGRFLSQQSGKVAELASLTGSSSAINVVSASFGLSGNISAAAWTTNGIRYKNVAATLTDTTSTGTVATAYTSSFGANTIAASSSTTFTNYFNSYFADPVAGANVTLTNKWALGADSVKIGTSNQLTITNAGLLTVPGTANFTGTFQVAGNAMTFPGSAATLAALNTTGQTITGGAIVTAQSQSTGSITVDCGTRPLQYITNNGAYTITAPSNDGSCMLFVTNGASAGATTFTGFTVGSSTGASLTTTNGNKFTISVWRINGTSGYSIFAHQ